MRYVLLAVVLSGCATMINGRPEVVTWQDRLMPVASFQLDCSSEQLNVIALDRTHERAGVSGCGQRATYLYDGHSWNRADVVLPVVVEVR